MYDAVDAALDTRATFAAALKMQGPRFSAAQLLADWQVLEDEVRDRRPPIKVVAEVRQGIES